ncbi:MAG: methionyl-tRNA formyltransferase [Halobacteriota archaeon]
MRIPPDASIVYASCTRPGYDVLETLFDNGVPISEIVSITPDMADHHDVAKYRSFDRIAARHDVPIYYPEQYSMTAVDTDHFESVDADLLIVNGWQRLIPGPVLETFDRGALGNHGSAYGLPKGRGRSPLNWSLIEDLDRFLLSIIRLDPGVDSGSIAATRKFDITPFDTIQTLYHKVTIAIQSMLLEVIPPILAGTHEFEPQAGDPTYYPKRTPEDGELNWEEPTRRVYNLVRAVTDPYPGAFTFHEGTRIDIWELIPFSSDLAYDTAPGEIIEAFSTDEFVVSTPDGTVLVTDWEAEGWSPSSGMQLRSGGEPARVDGPEHEHNLTSDGGADE